MAKRTTRTHLIFLLAQGYLQTKNTTIKHGGMLLHHTNVARRIKGRVQTMDN
jgi:hypothetical protein